MFFSLNCICLILKLLMMFSLYLPYNFSIYLFSNLKYPFVLTVLCWLHNSGSYFLWNPTNPHLLTSDFNPFMVGHDYYISTAIFKLGHIHSWGCVKTSWGYTGKGSLKGISFLSSQFCVPVVCWLPFLTSPLMIPLFSPCGREAYRLPFPNLMKIHCLRI